ncbi:phosphotransferase [Providencia rettgeri]
MPVRGGESGDFVFRRGDGHAFAKMASPSAAVSSLESVTAFIWLKGRGVACPEVINWQEEQEGACLVITAIPGVPAADLSGADLLEAWPSMGQRLGAVHSLSVDQCPFERRLSRMFADTPLMWCPAMPSIPTSYRTRTEYAAAQSFGSCRTRATGAAQPRAHRYGCLPW